jgi:hypothetical protein
MKKRFKRIQAFLVIAISLFIPIFQAYLHYYDLTEADFLCFDLSFENPDEEISLIIKQNESKIFLSSASCIIFGLKIILAEQFPHSPSILCSFDQKALVLRC